jgi:hypothetical protein
VGIERDAPRAVHLRPRPHHGAHGGGRFKPEKLIDITLTAAPALVDAVLVALGVANQFTNNERNVLITYLGGPGATLDVLNDTDLRERKLGGLFALVMQSPVYQTH